MEIQGNIRNYLALHEVISEVARGTSNLVLCFLNLRSLASILIKYPVNFLPEQADNRYCLYFSLTDYREVLVRQIKPQFQSVSPNRPSSLGSVRLHRQPQQQSPLFERCLKHLPVLGNPLCLQTKPRHVFAA